MGGRVPTGGPVTQLLSPREVAARLGVSRSSAYELMRRCMQHMVIGSRTIRVSEVALRTFEAQRTSSIEQPAGIPAQLASLSGVIGRYDPRHQVPHVYLLISGEQIVYVGQTLTIHRRVHKHIEARKIFDHALFLEVPGDRLRLVEAAFIKAFRPPLNREPWRDGPLTEVERHCLAEMGLAP